MLVTLSACGKDDGISELQKQENKLLAMFDEENYPIPPRVPLRRANPILRKALPSRLGRRHTTLNWALTPLSATTIFITIRLRFFSVRAKLFTKSLLFPQGYSLRNQSKRRAKDLIYSLSRCQRVIIP